MVQTFFSILFSRTINEDSLFSILESKPNLMLIWFTRLCYGCTFSRPQDNYLVWQTLSLKMAEAFQSHAGVCLVQLMLFLLLTWRPIRTLGAQQPKMAAWHVILAFWLSRCSKLQIDVKTIDFEIWHCYSASAQTWRTVWQEKFLIGQFTWFGGNGVVTLAAQFTNTLTLSLAL